MKKIAILGVTGYIGRSLLREFFLEDSKNNKLFLFSRSHQVLHTHIKQEPKKTEYSIHAMSEFSSHEYDVIINCTGVSSASGLEIDPSEVFKVTEEIDACIISYLHRHPKALYVNLSSGAVYGDNFEKPATEKTTTVLSSGFSRASSYAVAKINAEAKHRVLSSYNIVDIRIFAFFSSLVDTDSPFLMSEVAKCILHKKVFETTKDDIIRDYATAKDLHSFIQCCIKKGKINDYFDMYSKKPISKFALLDALGKKYNLTYKVVKPQKKSASVAKSSYFSVSKKATKVLGYKPEYTSLNGVVNELDRLSLS
jgi:nucleoside-diphosphate-sugar epimerase